MTTDAVARETVRTYGPGEAAQHTGLSVDTLRYYERLGLLDAVARTPGGQRRYRASDLDVLSLMRCLRGTGMPVRDLQRYAELVRGGDESVPDRVALLREHRDRVCAHIADLQDQISRIDGKISYYQDVAAG